jgi:N-acyl-D-amino-acid deacylase
MAMKGIATAARLPFGYDPEGRFMKRLLVCLAMALTAGTILAMVVQGQVYPGGPQYNPFTGRQPPQVPYNPFTGAGSPPQPPNPFTGAPTPGGPAVNPYTGRPMPGPTGYNPLTGKYGVNQQTPEPTSPQVYSWPQGKFPVTGKAGPGLEPLDEAVQKIMTRHGIPGAALAVAKDGKLVYARGFGWADLTAALGVQPLTRFGLASLSKPLTALAILWLIEHGMLGLDDRAFDILRFIQPPPGARVDPNLKKITVRQLLNHSGGWDRNKSGDPTSFEPQIARSLGVPMHITDEQFISFMMGVRLDFEPGTKMEYSNVGYIILGRIIEKVSGQPYEQFVHEKVLTPAGVKGAFISQGRRPYRDGEARRYLAGTSVLLPPLDLPMVDACGAWTASAVDMVRVLSALDGSRGQPLLKGPTYRQMLAPPPPPLRPRADGSYNGLGWPSVTFSPRGYSYLHDGSFQGMRTFLKHTQSGINWVLLFNVQMHGDAVDVQIMRQSVEEIHQNIENLGKCPDIDLFPEF